MSPESILPILADRTIRAGPSLELKDKFFASRCRVPTPTDVSF